MINFNFDEKCYSCRACPTKTITMHENKEVSFIP